MKASYFHTNDVNDLLFDVEKTEFEAFAANSDYSHQIIGYPKGEKTLLNACSDRYELIPNSEIFLPVVEALNAKGIDFNASFEVFNNARFFGKFDLKDGGIKVAGTEDVIKPLISVNHSYNGLTKYNLLFGWFRFICSNGLTVPLEETKEFNLSITGRHTEKIKKSLEELMFKIEYFLDNKDLIAKPFEQMTDVWIEKWEDRVIEVLKATNINMIDTKNFNTLNSIKATIQAEAADDRVYCDPNKVNDWLIYNGINQYLFKNERNNAVPDVKQATDQKVLNYIVSHPQERKKVVAVN